MSAFLYYVAIVVSTEIDKYVGVSIVVGHYCELNSHMTGRPVDKQEKQAQNFSEY